MSESSINKHFRNEWKIIIGFTIGIILIAILFGILIPIFSSKLPIQDGSYVFQLRYSEHPNMPGIKLDAIVKDGSITLINNDKFDVFPKGVIDQGKILWHSKSKQWIVSNSNSDTNLDDVGGCSDGPSTIDLDKFEYWTC